MVADQYLPQIIGASRPDEIPCGFADFFFFLPPHFQAIGGEENN